MGLVRNLPPTAERANLYVDTIRGAFAIKSYGPQSIRDFNPEAFYALWIGLIASDGDCPAITCPRRRNIAALIRKMIQEAQTRHETGSLPTLETGLARCQLCQLESPPLGKISIPSIGSLF